MKLLLTASFFLLFYSASQAVVQFARVNTESSCLRIRTGPSLSHDRIDCLPRGTQVTLTGVPQGNFYPVELANGQVGFMFANLLDRSGTADEARPAAAPEAIDPSTCIPRAQRGAPRPTPGNRESFVRYFLPLALEFEEATGFPAALSLYTVGFESGWGRDDRLRNEHNVYHGVSCWSQGNTRTFTVQMRHRELTSTGVCRPTRTAHEGGRYYAFETPASSFVAYMDLIMNSDMNIYQRVRTTLSTAREAGRDPSIHNVAMSIEGYGISRQGHGTAREYVEILSRDAQALDRRLNISQYRLCPPDGDGDPQEDPTPFVGT